MLEDWSVGFSDPIYAEVLVKMHGFDILLGTVSSSSPYFFSLDWPIATVVDVLLVNQSSDTLQNLCLDFATLGDLKIVERPSVYTIAPHGFQTIKATIKVSSTETGVIFGSILWEGPHLSEQCVILNDIHIDIMDYIKPTYCSEAQVSERLCFFCLISGRFLSGAFSRFALCFCFFMSSSAVCGRNLNGRIASMSTLHFRGNIFSLSLFSQLTFFAVAIPGNTLRKSWKLQICLVWHPRVRCLAIATSCRQTCTLVVYSVRD